MDIIERSSEGRVSPNYIAKIRSRQTAKSDAEPHCGLAFFAGSRLKCCLVRRVVLKHSIRCSQCRLPPRWCVCAAHVAVTLPLETDVLMHHREEYRWSSTGHLIERVVRPSRRHLWRRERRLTAADIHVPGRELWILHPQGESAPAGAAAENVQIVLLDGSWSEASAMAQQLGSRGRRVRLPMNGESRFWLRAQADESRFSTVETLLYLLRHFGLEREHEALRLRFELHVYAHLRARGHKERALEFLKTSPITTAFADLIDQLNVRRSAVGSSNSRVAP